MKRGCAKELAELLNDELAELVAVNTETDIPCNLVRKFRDHRPRTIDESDDDEEDDETALQSKNEQYTTKPNLCSCVSYKEKEELSRSRSKENSKVEMLTHHNGTLLELGAAYGQPDVVETLLKLGVNPYGIHDGTVTGFAALEPHPHVARPKSLPQVQKSSSLAFGEHRQRKILSPVGSMSYYNQKSQDEIPPY